MTLDKAVEIVGHKGYGYPENEIRDAFSIAIDAMQNRAESQDYRKKRSVIFCRKNLAMLCPTCRNRVAFGDPNFKGYAYCPYCGQALDWEVKTYEC